MEVVYEYTAMGGGAEYLREQVEAQSEKGWEPFLITSAVATDSDPTVFVVFRRQAQTEKRR